HDALPLCQRSAARSECAVRNCKVCTIQQIEPFDKRLDRYVIVEFEAAAQAQIERSEIKASSRVATDASRTIVVVCVKVSIVACHDVEWQARSVRKDIAQLEASQESLITP